MTRDVVEGQLLWTPSPAFAEGSQLARYRAWLQRRSGIAFAEYDELWSWSVEHPGAFRRSLWDYFGVVSDTPCTEVLECGSGPAGRWFPGTRTNYAEHIVRHE